MRAGPPAPVTLRSRLRPGDIGWIVHRHGVLYAREQGFDHTFEAYVAGPLAEFARANSPRDRLWIAERDNGFVGCIAVVAASPTTAQLRWFLVEPEARGQGVGTQLMREAVAFCRQSGYASVYLWTVSALTTAAHIYLRTGFARTEERPGRMWGVEVIEERYDLPLT